MQDQHTSSFASPIAASAQNYWPQAGHEPVTMPMFDATELDLGYEGAFPFFHGAQSDGAPS